ncbi:MAG: tRNA (adenosine(37)-N6)-dimethylallyltransferase MiaA [Pseudomonadota bacterium]
MTAGVMSVTAKIDKDAVPTMGNGVVLIAGPTASGKSALALRLAEASGGVIVNADSMQVYDELRILTARPSIDDEARVPHRLYGHVPAATPYSVAAWLDDVAQILTECRSDGRTAYVTGGTGLYFTSLLKGLSPIPDVPEDLRTDLRAKVADLSVLDLHAVLEDRDPIMADRLPTGDRQRIIRALEVLEATGQSLSVWQDLPRKPILGAHTRQRYVLAPDRDWLRQRVADRFQAMLDQGVLDEVSAFMALGVPESLPAARAHGVRPLAAYLRGDISLDEAAERTITETRQYAKRQETWFRNQFPNWERVEVATA